MWKNGKDVSVPDTLAETLQSRFNPEEVKTILSSANSAPFKQRLNDNTKEALDRNAFGCPWFWVRNARGAEEPFFGSDRYATAQSTPLFIAGRSVSDMVLAPADGLVRGPGVNYVRMKAFRREPGFCCRTGANVAF